MPAIRGPRNKLSRREGVDLFGNGGESLQRRLNKMPGQQSLRPPKQQSEYSRQLREKQKVKRMYGMRENQFRRFFIEAARVKGVTGAELLKMLERRLDNVVYRLGFSRTRLQSRQLVVHGQVLVDGHKVDRPSFLVKPGMTITLSPVAQRIPSVQELIESSLPVPGWLERSGAVGTASRAMPPLNAVGTASRAMPPLNAVGTASRAMPPLNAAGRVVRYPERAEIDADINETAIVEFYSR